MCSKVYLEVILKCADTGQEGRLVFHYHNLLQHHIGIICEEEKLALDTAMGWQVCTMQGVLSASMSCPPLRKVRVVLTFSGASVAKFAASQWYSAFLSEASTSTCSSALVMPSCTSLSDGSSFLAPSTTLYHLRVGGGTPPLEEQVRVIASPSNTCLLVSLPSMTGDSGAENDEGSF